MASAESSGALLNLCLSVDYQEQPGVLRDACLQVDSAEIVGVVGESGAGKSTLAMAVLGLLDQRHAKVKGQIIFEGTDLLRLNGAQIRAIRGQKIALILQDSQLALNPAITLEDHFRVVWRAHSRLPWKEGKERVFQLFQELGLPLTGSFLAKKPRQISVGQAQRVVIAMALVHGPKLLVADEPTSALDAIHRKELLDLFVRLRESHQMAILLISHDLAAIAAICDRIAVLAEGRIVEEGKPWKIFQAPTHPFTRRLVETARLELPARLC